MCIPFVVLDHPNPLDGEYFARLVLETGCRSNVAEYPIPVALLLTIILTSLKDCP